MAQDLDSKGAVLVGMIIAKDFLGHYRAVRPSLGIADVGCSIPRTDEMFAAVRAKVEEQEKKR